MTEKCLTGVLALTGAILALAGVTGCSREESPAGSEGPSTPHVADDSAAGPPEDWADFLIWADHELGREPATVPFPAEVRWPEPRWPVLRLEERLAGAEVTCLWQPAEATSSEPLATLGPFRGDQAQANLSVSTQLDQHFGPVKLLTLTGFRVRREDVGSIAIELRVPYGRHIDLLWSAAGTIRLPLPDNQHFWTLSVATDGLTEWLGPLEELRLRTDGVGPGTIEVRSLRFLPRTETFPRPVGVRRVQVGRETRTALYAHCPVTLRFGGLALPPGARLQVGLGQSGSAVAPGAAAHAATMTEFEILVDDGTTSTTVFRRRLEPGEEWVDVAVGLEAWGGRTVSLTLRALSDAFGSVALWANPVIYQPVEDAPCFVLYLIDALGAKHMDLYGYERPTTPNISQLASEGVFFSRAFCNSPVTAASVPDAQFSLPTGRHRVYATGIPAPAELVSLAEVLRAAGFATALFSTNAHAGPRQGTDQGFDHFIDRVYCGPRQLCDRTVPLEELRHWLEVHADRPAYVYIHTAEPHAPYTPPPGFAGRFDPDYVGLVTGQTAVSGEPFGIDPQHRERDIAHARALYDEEVLYADARFGMFRELLAELGLASRTTIFLIADHGEELGEHGNWGHGRSLHTEVLHIPFVAAGPLVAARGRIDVPVQLLDLMPTVLDLLELPLPYALAGTSLRPLLTGDDRGAAEALGGRTIFHSHYRYYGLGIVQYVVIEAGRWKLMYYYQENPENPDALPMRFALYDLAEQLYDPRDVFDAQRGVARRLIEKLVAHHRRQGPFDIAVARPPLEFDAEQIRALQALGYLADDGE